MTFTINIRLSVHIILIILFNGTCCHALEDIRIDERNSLFSALDKTFPVVTTSYIGWAKNWKWADTQLHPVYQRKNPYSSFTGRVSELGIDFSGN